MKMITSRISRPLFNNASTAPNHRVHVLASLIVFLIAVHCSSTSASAQIRQGSGYPSQTYFSAMRMLNQGELRDGAKMFRTAASDGYITGAGRWVDSICYHTMIGECLYQSGDLNGAMEQYEAALTMYVSHPTWLKTADFPVSINVASNVAERTRITWGQSTRKTAFAAAPDAVPILFGSDADNLNSLQQGGVLQSPTYRRFNAHEISRCTALAISRRAEILGPLTKYDPVLKQAADATGGGNGNRHPYAVTWSTALNGFGLAAMGENEKAVKALRSSIQVAGKYDHPLTPLILLELAKINYRSGNYKDAGTYAMEASYSAAVFDHQDVLVESFQLATAVYLVTGEKGIFPPLDPAAEWARKKGSSRFEAVVPILAAQCMTESGQPAKALALLKSAQQAMKRTDLAKSTLGTDYFYRSAHAFFQQQNMKDGLANFDTALKSQINSSKWLYQIATTDNLFRAGRITPHSTGQLFEILLREPTQNDWRSDPVDTLAYVSLPQLKERLDWFGIAVERKDFEKALKISDDIRRHRFYSTLPIGGRILALQSMLESPEETLAPESLKIRQAFLLKHPKYGMLSNEANQLLIKLRAMPLNQDPKSDEAKTQKELMAQLGKITALQEAYLADVSLRREPSVFSFPAQLKAEEEIRSKLKDGQVVVSFLATDRGVFSFVITKEKSGVQKNGDLPLRIDIGKVRGNLKTLLQKIGNLDPNNQLKAETFADDSWRKPATELMSLVLPNTNAEFWRKQTELIIIPDGILWYLPFEVLQVTDGDKTHNLADRVKIRYAPTISTAFSDPRPVKVDATRAFVTGKLYLRDELSISQGKFEEIKSKLNGSVAVPFKLPGSSKVFSALFDDLIVWDDIEESSRQLGYNWSPLQIDAGKPGSSLRDWMSLPNHGPTHVYLPGFHTNAASGLKGRTNGDEVFLSVCGLMAGGARTVFISRWRVGGQSAYQLTERLIRNVPKMPAVDAWRDSLEEFLSEEEVPIASEPRIKKSQTVTTVKSSHPFFWAGYMLIDSGSFPAEP